MNAVRRVLLASCCQARTRRIRPELGICASNCVDVLGRYSNRGDIARVLDRLAGLPTVVRDEPVLRRRRQVVDEETENALVEAYKGGASTYRLGREFGLHRQRVSAVLLKKGVEPRYRVVTDEVAAEMREMYNAGHSQSAIARHFGVARGTVTRAVLG